MMTDRDDELKEFFKSRPPQEDFSFDPEGWEKMNAVLKAEKKANRLRFFIYLNMLLMVLGITAAFLFFNNEDSLEKLATSSTQTINSLPKKEFNADEEQKKAELVNKEIPAVQTSKNNPPETSNADLNKQKTTRTQGESTIKNFDLTTIPYIKDLWAARAEITLRRVVSPLPEILGLEGRKETGKGTGEQLNQENPLNGVQEGGQVKSPGAIANANDRSPQNSKKDSVSLVVNPGANTKADSIKEKPNEKTADLKPVQAKKDSLVKAVTLPKDSNTAKPSLKKILSFEIGSDYLLGWKSGGKKEANGFNPIVGLNYFNGITDKVGFSIGVQYNSVNNLKETSHTSTHTKLKFGEEIDVTTISARKMHYLVVPLKLSYALNEKNILGIGYNLAYLLDVKSDVTTYTERFNKQINHEAKSAMGYKTGFSDLDGQIAFCYRRFIYKGFFINAEFFYGIKDIKNNSVYKTELFERNSGFKLSLSYNLFTK